MKSEELVNKHRISKLDVIDLAEQIKYFTTANFKMISNENPKGELLYWSWEYRGIAYPHLTTRESYWLLKGIVMGLRMFSPDPHTSMYLNKEGIAKEKGQSITEVSPEMIEEMLKNGHKISET